MERFRRPANARQCFGRTSIRCFVLTVALCFLSPRINVFSAHPTAALLNAKTLEKLQLHPQPVFARPARLQVEPPSCRYGYGSLALLTGAGLCGAISAMLVQLRPGRSLAQRTHRLVGRQAVQLQDRSVDALFVRFEKEISSIRALIANLVEDEDDILLLRLVLEHESDTAAALDNLKEIVQWRSGAGKHIVEAASRAVKEATSGGAWDNDVVFAAAPHSGRLSKFYTPSQYLVLNLPNGDLCSIVRAAKIDSGALMDEITVDELLEFCLYAREVNHLVADSRSRRTGQLCQVVSTNDFIGISGPPDKRFQQVLGDVSKRASRLWPGLAGPTVMLNLPWLVRFIVGALKPLFPKSVQARIKFAKQGIEYFDDLSEATKEPVRGRFVRDLSDVLAE